MMSERVKQAVRISISIVLAYTISLWMDWDRSYWAGLAAGLCALATDGESLQKGLLRIAGTVLAIAVLFTLLALLHQERLQMLLALGAYMFFCAYMMAGTRRWYFWFHGAFLVLVIGTSTHQDPATSFELASLRGLQTLTGIACFTFVAAVLFPTSSRDRFVAAMRQQTSTLSALHAEAVASFRDGEKTARFAQLRREAARQQAGLTAALDAASLDSLDVLQELRHWRTAVTKLGEIGEALDRWMLLLPEHRGLDAEASLQGFAAFSDEMSRRFDAALAMIDGGAPQVWPQSAPVRLGTARDGQESAFSHGALRLACDQLARADEATQALVGALAKICRLPWVEAGEEHAKRRTESLATVIPDPERVMAAVRATVGFWLAVIVYVFLPDIPFGNVLLIFACAAGLMMAMIMPQGSPSGTLVPVLTGSVFALLLHVLVMPELHGFAGLVVLLGLAAYLICYLFYRPDQVIFKTFGILMLVTGTQIDNQQTYSFLYVPNIVIASCAAILILIVVRHVPFDFTPQQAFERLLRRLFNSLSVVVRSMSAGAAASDGWWQRQRLSYHKRQLDLLPAKLGKWAAALPPETLGGGGREGIETLVTSLTVLGDRLHQLTEVQAGAQPEAWAGELQSELVGWGEAIADFAAAIAGRPEALDPAVLKRKLEIRLARMEQLVADAVSNGRGEEGVSVGSHDLYRLLAAYRGISESLNSVVDDSARIDWLRLREPRFYF